MCGDGGVAADLKLLAKALGVKEGGNGRSLASPRADEGDTSSARSTQLGSGRKALCRVLHQREHFSRFDHAITSATAARGLQLEVAHATSWPDECDAGGIERWRDRTWTVDF